MSTNFTITGSKFLLVLTLALSTASISLSAANLVKNGSFENIGANTQSFFVRYDRAGLGLPDWQLSSYTDYACLSYHSTNPVCSSSEYIFSLWVHPGVSPDGGNSFIMDSDSSYSRDFFQVINGLTVGQDYKLTFYQASGQFSTTRGATTEQWEVTFGNETRLSTLIHTPDQGSVGWMQETMHFTAQATTQTLNFFAIGTPNGLPPVNLLDGVVLQEDGPPVPEPGTFATIGFGLLALPIMNRIRSRRRK